MGAVIGYAIYICCGLFFQSDVQSCFQLPLICIHKASPPRVLTMCERLAENGLAIAVGVPTLEVQNKHSQGISLAANIVSTISGAGTVSIHRCSHAANARIRGCVFLCI